MKKTNQPQAQPTQKSSTKKNMQYTQNLTQTQQVEIKKAFDYFDITGSGMN